MLMLIVIASLNPITQITQDRTTLKTKHIYFLDILTVWYSFRNKITSFQCSNQICDVIIAGLLNATHKTFFLCRKRHPDSILISLNRKKNNQINPSAMLSMLSRRTNRVRVYKRLKRLFDER